MQPPGTPAAGNMGSMTTFSDGYTLTQWLVRLGAPELPTGTSYLINTEHERSATRVTISIRNDWSGKIEAQASAATRVSMDMAAVSAAIAALDAFESQRGITVRLPGVIPCSTCGHRHDTMASIWTPATDTRWYCHEDDHSCYSDRNQQILRSQIVDLDPQ